MDWIVLNPIKSYPPKSDKVVSPSHMPSFLSQRRMSGLALRSAVGSICTQFRDMQKTKYLFPLGLDLAIQAQKGRNQSNSACSVACSGDPSGAGGTITILQLP